MACFPACWGRTNLTRSFDPVAITCRRLVRRRFPLPDDSAAPCRCRGMNPTESPGPCPTASAPAVAVRNHSPCSPWPNHSKLCNVIRSRQYRKKQICGAAATIIYFRFIFVQARRPIAEIAIKFDYPLRPPFAWMPANGATPGFSRTSHIGNRERWRVIRNKFRLPRDAIHMDQIPAITFDYLYFMEPYFPCIPSIARRDGRHEIAITCRDRADAMIHRPRPGRSRRSEPAAMPPSRS